MNRRNLAVLLVGSILVLAIALGATVVMAQTDQDPDTPPESDEAVPEDESEVPFPHWGKRGFGFHDQLGGLTPMDELIADELGISVDDLHDAYAQAIAAAREDGVLDFHRHHGFANDAGLNSYLSDALADIGVTIDQLEAAKESAREVMLDELLDQGVITEDQLALMEAQQALQDYINLEDILVEAAASLGIELPDLESAKEEGTSLYALLEEQGVTLQEFTDARQAAYENAVAQAVEDGIITDEQASLILNSDGLCQGGMHGFGDMHGFGKMHGFGGMRGSGGMRGIPGPGGFPGFGSMNGNVFSSGSSL